MPLTADFSLNIKLVEAIKEFPCLYNTFLSEYSKREDTDEAWDKIARIMGEPAVECKQKWRNLRTVYVRKLRSDMELGEEAKKRKPYYLTKAMAFLLPFVRVNKSFYKPRNSENVSPEFEFVETDLSNSEEAADFSNATADDACPNEHPEMRHTDLGSPAYSTNVVSVKIEEQNATQILPNRSCQNSEIASSSRNLDLVKRKRRFSEDNPRRQFLLSMEPDLEVMTDAQMRQFKRRVLEVVDDILKESC